MLNTFFGLNGDNNSKPKKKAYITGNIFNSKRKVNNNMMNKIRSLTYSLPNTKSVVGKTNEDLEKKQITYLSEESLKKLKTKQFGKILSNFSEKNEYYKYVETKQSPSNLVIINTISEIDYDEKKGKNKNNLENSKIKIGYTIDNSFTEHIKENIKKDNVKKIIVNVKKIIF